MASHFLLLAVFSAFVSVVFAALLRDTVRDQLRLGARLWVAMIATAIVIGWLMYPFPI